MSNKALQPCQKNKYFNLEDSKKGINVMHKTFATLLFVTGQVLALKQMFFLFVTGTNCCCRVSTDVATFAITTHRAPSIVTSYRAEWPT